MSGVQKGSSALGIDRKTSRPLKKQPQPIGPNKKTRDLEQSASREDEGGRKESIRRHLAHGHRPYFGECNDKKQAYRERSLVSC